VHQLLPEKNVTTVCTTQRKEVKSDMWLIMCLMY